MKVEKIIQLKFEITALLKPFRGRFLSRASLPGIRGAYARGAGVQLPILGKSI